MLHVAARCAHTRADMQRPLPSWLLGGASDSHPANVDNLELPFFESPNLVRFFKALENRFHCRHFETSPLTFRERPVLSVCNGRQNGELVPVLLHHLSVRGQRK